MLLTSSLRPSGRAAQWLTAAALGTALVIGGGLAAAPASAATATYTGIILGVGADEAQRVVTWYSTEDSAQTVQVTPTAALNNGEFVADLTTSFTATGAQNTAGDTAAFNRHATITGLQENTEYTYRVGSDGNWSTAYSFKTQSFDGEFNFLFFGDPQIGSSGSATNDGAGWQKTLDVALGAFPNTEILVSGGDQVETANTESQWDAFLGPDQLRSYPWAATIGNHDVGGKAYEQHLYTPNTDYSGDYYAGNSATQSGGDYWYIYKDVLFIDLNSNSYAAKADGTGGDAAHVKYVTDIVNQHGAEAKYTVLVYHHSIYSPASHAKDGDNKARRQDFPTTFSKLGVDLVLQGHDHSYSRSYEIKNGVKANPDEQPGQNEVTVGEGGVIYLTANSASGSKYYGITKPDADGTNGPDPLNPGSYWYNSVQSQENKRSYVNVEVKKDKLVVENIRSEQSPNGEIGSTIDQVTINPYHDGQDIQVDVPEQAPGEFAWTIDGKNGLVDLGEAQETDGHFAAAGDINPISVTDTRKSQGAWSLTGVVGDFRDGKKTFAGKYLGWTPKVVTEGAGTRAGAAVKSAFDDNGKGLSVSRVLGSASQGHDRGEAVVGAGLDLKFPIDTEKGSYRATLTLTALAG